MTTAASQSSDDRFAAQLRGFGPVGIMAMVVILSGTAVFNVLGAVLVIVWVRLSRTPWREIGYVRPRSWIVTVAGGVVFGVALKLLLKAIVMPLLGGDPINHAYHYLAGNRAAIPFALFTLTIGAGWGEETVYRGFLFERLGKLFGAGVAGKTAIVLIVSVLFGLAHYPVQGLTGMEQAMITGLVFGTIVAVSGRIGMVMIAHAAYDLAAYAIIYWNLEATVAHLVFR
ncbi:MAG TPA: CPBP family intramembrane glutamic endopeptidase [Thermoanaerobaculia bacterium]|nr:CPBP family intramembrane glutamic endopeptidase [Thermoanaerobaculia bacterium]